MQWHVGTMNYYEEWLVQMNLFIYLFNSKALLQLLQCSAFLSSLILAVQMKFKQIYSVS